jgi:coenzyme F420-dependent glucose-6-phosphate dehydrogenase
MLRIGYSLSSEENSPSNLVKFAQIAEEVGFNFALISDHFHPWVSYQGESPFVWSILGAIAQVTDRMQIGTGVTCPIMRIHPAIIAQAAGTVAAMMPGRFFLGVGTGEYLNEHIFGDAWPSVQDRQEMLVEAVEIIRGMWIGEEFSHDGVYYTVRDARLYTLPEHELPIYMAASGKQSAKIAAEIATGLITTIPEEEIVDEYRANGGQDKPVLLQMKVCWAPTEDQAREVMMKWWPISALSGLLHVDLPTPKHFEDAVKLIEEPHITKETPMGPDPQPFLEAIQKAYGKGYDHIYLHQVGADQAGFLEFFRSKLLPQLKSERILTGTL